MLINLSDLESVHLDWLLSDHLTILAEFRDSVDNLEVKDSFSRMIDSYTSILHKVKRGGSQL